LNMHTGLIIKATRLCNLRCTYCHDWREGSDQVMAFPVLVSLIDAALRDPTHQSVEFIWHGGETTLLPRSFYEKAIFLQAQFRRPGQVIRNSMQTNGTRLTRDWISFFRANGISVGISLDGPPELNDRMRVNRSGRGSFERIRRGMDLWRDGNVSFSLLMVVDEEALEIGPDRIFDFFVETNVKSVAFLAAAPANQPAALPRTNAAHYVDPLRMGAFLKCIYDRWVAQGEDSMHIREFKSLRARIQGDDGGFCTLSGSCLGRYFMVEPDGTVAHCDLFVGDERYILGNITCEDFAAIRNAERLRSLEADWREERNQMASCPEFAICQGWCPHERYLSKRHSLAHTQSCCGLRDLIEHIRLKSLARDAQLTRR
jgi:uncharacterized protein